MDEIILDLATWHAAENPDEHEVVDEEFDMAAELAAADADDGGDGTLPPGAVLPDDFEEL